MVMTTVILSYLQITDPKDAVIRLSQHYGGEPNSVGDSMAVSKRKKRMANVKVRNGKMVTIGKRSGRVYDIPLVRDAGAHFIPQHRSRLECTACHSQWVVRCPCLLYTSPSPRDRTRSRMPSSA